MITDLLMMLFIAIEKGTTGNRAFFIIIYTEKFSLTPCLKIRGWLLLDRDGVNSGVGKC